MPSIIRRLIAALWAVAVHQVSGDLGAALRRQAHSHKSDEAKPLPLSGPLVVPLERVDARPIAAQAGHTRDSFYVANISVGHPAQQLRVLFDTGSGHVLLAHRACKSPACAEHRRYSPWESSSSADVNPDGAAVKPGERLASGAVNRTVVTVEFSQADLGKGAAQGVLVRDTVCLSSAAGDTRACADTAILAAVSLDEHPFRAMPHDGIVGLGLEGLAAGALSSFYERLMDGSHELLPHFGLALGPRGGEIAFGGHDPTRLAAPLQWFPVPHPEHGFWQVEIRAVRVGGTTVDTCEGGCRGVVDTGSSSLGVPARRMATLLPSLRSTRTASGACEGPDLHLDLGGFSLVLSADDYTGSSCEPELGALDLQEPEFTGVYALGTSVLTRYYTAFDWSGARVGFAPVSTPAQQSQVGEGASLLLV